MDVCHYIDIVMTRSWRISNSKTQWKIFLIKIMLSSSLPPIVCRWTHVLFTLFVFVCVNYCPTHTVLGGGGVSVLLPVSLDCPFLISLSVFSNIYILFTNIVMTRSFRIWNHQTNWFIDSAWISLVVIRWEYLNRILCMLHIYIV